MPGIGRVSALDHALVPFAPGLTTYSYDSEGHLESASTVQCEDATPPNTPTTP